MSGIQQADGEAGLIYMVTGVDEHGDTHILVTGDLRRAEARHREVEAHMTDVKANWLDD